MDGEDIQLLIETNKPSQIEDLKKKFYEQFSATKDPWLLNGIFDCYLQTSSLRLVEILVGVREPHDVHLFNKLSETLRGQSKLQALTLLGHVVRKRPTWLIKIVKHSVLNDLLRILKMETDILLLMSALLIIIILLPMIPSLMAQHLNEIFEVFSRLAAWNTNNPNKVPEYNLIHLQLGLFELFNRLYGMYPCNFLSYLRQQYIQRENLDVFSHTIKPMVCSVRMHPQLVTTSKDAETAASRWKKMEDHDVIVECAKYVLEATRDDFGLISSSIAHRSHSTTDLKMALEKSQQSFGKSMASDLVLTYDGEWSPITRCGLNTPPPPESTPTSIPHTPIQQSYVASTSFPHQEGTSPPEAAIEATPETTPIKDPRLLSRQPLAPSTVVRALNHSLSSGGGALPQKWAGGLAVSTSYSQPSSPLKKEPSPFRFSGINQQMTATPPPTFPSEVSSVSAFQQPRRDSLPLGSHESTSMARRVANLVQERKQVSSETFVDKLPVAPTSNKPRSSALSNFTPSSSSAMRLPSSPLRVIGSTGVPPESPVPIEPTAPIPGSRDWPITRPTPEKNGFNISEGHSTHISSSSLYHPNDSTQEDQEVVEIVRQGEQFRNDSHTVNVQTPQPMSRHCDSVLQEFPVTHNHDQDCEMDGDECLQEQSGSPCASGGLHMPNSVMNFTRKAHRMRYFSQCLPSLQHQILSDSNIGSTGSSPGNGTSFPSGKVRRTNSCPEMEKSQGDFKVDCTVEEREEFEDCLQNEDATTPQNSIGEEALVNGCTHLHCKPVMKSEGTQTQEFAPYEHLFMSVFPKMDTLTNLAPSPALQSGYNDQNICETKLENVSPHTHWDHFLWSILDNRPKNVEAENGESKLKEQVMLLNIQLQFERQRREVHAERNRRLLGRSRDNRALEEVKTALKEQLSLVQHELESKNKEVTKQREEYMRRIQEELSSGKYWEERCIQAQNSSREWKSKYEEMEQKFLQEQKFTASVQKEYQKAQSKLLDISNEKRQAEMSAAAAERLRADVQQLQRELFLAGEQHQRLNEKIQYMTLNHNRPEEYTSIKEAYHAELNNLRQMLDSKHSALEAAEARLAELQANANNVAHHMNEKKRQLKVVKDEYNDQLQSVESKYQAQKKINQRLQENNLELLKTIAELKSKRKREGREPSASQPAATSSSSHPSHPKSPDSVCSDDRLPHSSSPLSESLSSSEGMSLQGILARDVSTIQNLQVIVDQPEQPMEAVVTPASPSSPSKTKSTASTVACSNSPSGEG